MSEDHSQGTAYEAPALLVLGPVTELTLGGGPGGPGDSTATYEPDTITPSDVRVKRDIRAVPNALERLHRLGR